MRLHHRPDAPHSEASQCQHPREQEDGERVEDDDAILDEYIELNSLNILNCSSNLITSLDVSQNTALTVLYCYNNQLTTLDVRNGNNTKVFYFFCGNNPLLYCIDVDDAASSTTNWTNIDPHHYFSENCPLKNKSALFLLHIKQ